MKLQRVKIIPEAARRTHFLLSSVFSLYSFYCDLSKKNISFVRIRIIAGKIITSGIIFQYHASKYSCSCPTMEAFTDFAILSSCFAGTKANGLIICCLKTPSLKALLAALLVVVLFWTAEWLLSLFSIVPFCWLQRIARARCFQRLPICSFSSTADSSTFPDHFGLDYHAFWSIYQCYDTVRYYNSSGSWQCRVNEFRRTIGVVLEWYYIQRNVFLSDRSK